ncbi:hypothetical protein MAPG_00188 [Magnaporthiopsis poae ATCC 64411]|uniref:Uncharacterized protein n=1 Tax=Magnaporthiopsis poae (strain ATCC 64411 / 73-15) TaxID=644358 RepID=A0A0C4DKC0_MAGP6|nr:hypothetical protein MAPG_00188 [Magnaporthiopsis poae ATCC 64411]
MKTQHVSLPALQLAAALYFADAAAAVPTQQQTQQGLRPHCVDASGTEVAGNLCDDNQKRGTYFFATRDVVDSTDKLARRGAGLPETGGVVERSPMFLRPRIIRIGGFGRKEEDEEHRFRHGG